MRFESASDFWSMLMKRFFDEASDTTTMLLQHVYFAIGFCIQ